eukprot:TRINITY_DN9687_c0_g1_i2.p1 TRINITY_DN9687_c0_g1~~TRINITY_DN9687_c0_g1_i2.p1  ORF type:complete len:293 (+),score=28.06 TRINITY_DN9687_c0_g1_i2:1214-2092(+)
MQVVGLRTQHVRRGVICGLLCLLAAPLVVPPDSPSRGNSVRPQHLGSGVTRSLTPTASPAPSPHGQQRAEKTLCRIVLVAYEDGLPEPVNPSQPTAHRLEYNESHLSKQCWPAQGQRVECVVKEGEEEMELVLHDGWMRAVTPPNYAGTMEGRCHGVDAVLEVLGVADYPVATAQSKFSVLLADPGQTRVEIPGFFQGMSAGPPGASDEDYESLYSPMYCTCRGLSLQAEPMVHVHDMQVTVSHPTVGDLEMHIDAGAEGTVEVQCTLRDTSGLQTVLPWRTVELMRNSSVL